MRQDSVSSLGRVVRLSMDAMEFESRLRVMRFGSSARSTKDNRFSEMSRCFEQLKGMDIAKSKASRLLLPIEIRVM